mmetsp:Transcript_80360/g.260350  ORF Transcript_80360/g.260350 Transcript_80360/m.260350 type:complete len:321 (+) Transcript_80360:896-1858(+)
MYCSLWALLVIFWALNFALSMSFIAKSSRVSLCRTRLTLPKAPSPRRLTSTKSSKLTFTGGWSPAPQTSASSWMVVRMAWLSAPRPALSMKEEMPQFVTASEALAPASALCVRLRSSCSASLQTERSGTSCRALRCGPCAGSSMASTPAAGGPAAKELQPRACSSQSSTPAAAQATPASALCSSSCTRNSGLLRSKLNLRGFVAKSAGTSPFLFLSLKFTLGSLSSSCRAPRFCLRAAMWIAVSPSAFVALRNSGSSPLSCLRQRMAAGEGCMTARWRAVFRALLPVREWRFARSCTSSRMHSTWPRRAARCSGARPSGP